MDRLTSRPAARRLSASAGSSLMPGCGARPASSPGSRSTPNRRRVSVRACRPLCSISSRVAGSAPPEARAPAACSTTTLRWWALIGAFAGAPVLAREMETGTFRFAWTQGFGRWRWALAKLAALAVVLAAAAGAVGVLVSWHYQPYFAPGNQALGLTELSTFDTGLFNLHGLAFPAWTLAAFAIGALAGMLIRRVVPAILATLAVYTGLAFAAGLYLRPHYLAPLVTRNPNVPGSAWILSQWSTKDGRFAFAG